MGSLTWSALEFGLEVRRLRRSRGRSIRAIAGAIGSEKSISVAWRLEQGLRGTVPTPRQIRGLSGELGVGEEHLLRAAGYGVVCSCSWCTTGVGRRRVVTRDGDDE